MKSASGETKHRRPGCLPIIMTKTWKCPKCNTKSFAFMKPEPEGECAFCGIKTNRKGTWQRYQRQWLSCKDCTHYDYCLDASLLKIVQDCPKFKQKG